MPANGRCSPALMRASTAAASLTASGFSSSVVWNSRVSLMRARLASASSAALSLPACTSSASSAMGRVRSADLAIEHPLYHNVAVFLRRSAGQELLARRARPDLVFAPDIGEPGDLICGVHAGNIDFLQLVHKR